MLLHGMSGMEDVLFTEALLIRLVCGADRHRQVNQAAVQLMAHSRAGHGSSIRSSRTKTCLRMYLACQTAYTLCVSLGSAAG